MSGKEYYEEKAKERRKQEETSRKKIEELLSTEEGFDKFMKAVVNQMVDDVENYESPIGDIARKLLKE
jgi:hypothetical protein